ncbi:endonuclease [Lactococcus lactis]|uniref:NUMOD4 motif-containing HNH endonuclease n=1 Tax=Lactococcus lactis TaxID=1358 RepID=UPI0021A416B3|nr:NUMOD4 motif-containing HNH endonuclease [Lactococcus lactis]MCT3083919.1 endonuclease [Lactococcus lactis]MCT3121601.1 endonuclease [Lactococcus lactis]
MEKEEWKDVVGYEGLYKVSNLGRVKSFHGDTPIILKQRLDGSVGNYLMIGLSKDGKQKKIKVHRLVAKAFVINSDNKPEVNHIDENKLNNRADNLEWVTHYENCIHGTRLQRRSDSMRKSIKSRMASINNLRRSRI